MCFFFGNTGQQRLYERVATSLRNFHSWSAIFVNLLYICSSFTQWLNDLQEAVPVKSSGSLGQRSTGSTGKITSTSSTYTMKNTHFEDLWRNDDEWCILRDLSSKSQLGFQILPCRESGRLQTVASRHLFQQDWGQSWLPLKRLSLSWTWFKEQEQNQSIDCIEAQLQFNLYTGDRYDSSRHFETAHDWSQLLAAAQMRTIWVWALRAAMNNALAPWWPTLFLSCALGFGLHGLCTTLWAISGCSYAVPMWAHFRMVEALGRGKAWESLQRKTQTQEALTRAASDSWALHHQQ